MKDKIVILGGGTISHIKSHLALCAPAYGTTAKQIKKYLEGMEHDYDIQLILTKMAGGMIETNEDVEQVMKNLIQSPCTKIVFLNCALVDFNAVMFSQNKEGSTGKYSGRLNSNLPYNISLQPAEKIIGTIREERKDIFVVGFKTTCGEDPEDQYLSGLSLLKRSSCNLVLANDVKTRVNMIITPEESVQLASMDRDKVLKELCSIALLRSGLTFTATNVIDGTRVRWEDELLPTSFKSVIQHCIDNNAYKVNPHGFTVGHFAHKIAENEFIMSRRKVNYKMIKRAGMVKVTLDGEEITAHGYKPSAGARSQIQVYKDHTDCDSIIHFHCPLKEDHPDDIQTNDQRPYECGSHECGTNTVDALKQFGNLWCGMLDKHGPNIVWNSKTDPNEIIDFINRNFDLSKKTNQIILE